MRPRVITFSVVLASLLAFSLLLIPQDCSASFPSHVMSPTPDVAGADPGSYYVYFITEGRSYDVGSQVPVKGQVFVLGPESVKGIYVMVTMEDPNGMEYLELTNASAEGIFETSFELRYDVPGMYTITASADAMEDRKYDGQIEIMVIRPTPEETEEQVNPVVFIQIGALIAAFVSFAIASTESAGFSLFNIIAFPMYSRIKKEEVLDHFVRGQIYGYIVSNPGEHYNSIREALKVTNGNLAYHLRTLEVQGFIKSRKEGLYRRFYPVEMRFPRDEGVKLSDLQMAILQLTRERPAPTQKEIASELEISQQVASYNLRVLAMKGLVHVRKEGRKRLYHEADSQAPVGL